MFQLDDWVLCRIYNKCKNHPRSSSDRDYEDSNSGDVFFLPGDGDAAPQNGAKLPKSSSLSELLDDADFSILTRLFHDNPSDMAGPELGPFLGQVSLNQPFLGVGGDGAASFSVLPKLTPVEPPAPVVGSYFKRQRVAAADYGEAVGDTASPQCNMLNSPFLHQQILLNSRFGLP